MAVLLAKGEDSLTPSISKSYESPLSSQNSYIAT